VRDLRTLVGQRDKMIRLKTQVKNRLQDVLFRYSILPPEGPLFEAAQQAWWKALPVGKLEHVRIESDLAALDFTQQQIAQLDMHLAQWAAQDERIPRCSRSAGWDWSQR